MIYFVAVFLFMNNRNNGMEWSKTVNHNRFFSPLSSVEFESKHVEEKERNNFNNHHFIIINLPEPSR